MKFIDRLKTGNPETSTSQSNLRWLIFFLLILLLIWSPLPAASVENWSVFILQIVVVVMAASYIFLEPKPVISSMLASLTKRMRMFILGFFGLLTLQIVPLPAFIIKYLSPAAFAFHQQYNPLFSETKFLTLSVAPGRTLMFALELATYFLLGFLIIKTVNQSYQFVTIITVLIISGLFQSVYGLYELTRSSPRILFYPKIFSPDALTGTFVNRNHLSAYLEMIIPLAIGLLISRLNLFSGGARTLRERILLWSAQGAAKNFIILTSVVVMGFGIILANSRSGLVVLAFSFIMLTGLYVFYSPRPGLNEPRVRNMLRLAFLLIMLLGLYKGIDTTVERFAMDDLLQENRPVYWTNTLNLFLDFPLFGSGLGSFVEIYPAYEKIPGPPMLLVHAHNDYLEFLAETGLIGSFFLFGGIFYLVAKSFRIWASRRNPEVKGLALGGLVSLAGMVIHTFTDFNLHIPANAVLFTLVITMTAAVSCHRMAAETKK